MVHFTNTIQIARPVAEVFAFIADYTHMPLWNYYVLHISQETAGQVQLGTVFQQKRKTDQQRIQVVEYAPPQVIAFQTLPPALALRMRFLLSASSGGTLIEDTWEGTVGLPRVLEELAKGRVQRAAAKNLAVLKRLLETGSAHLPDGRRVSYAS